MNGIVKTKTDKGYGFISRDGEDKDLFFHSTNLSGVSFDELQVGASVTFDVENGEKGPAAKNVRLASAAESSSAGQAEDQEEVSAEAEPEMEAAEETAEAESTEEVASEESEEEKTA